MVRPVVADNIVEFARTQKIWVAARLTAAIMSNRFADAGKSEPRRTTNPNATPPTAIAPSESVAARKRTDRNPKRSRN